MANKKCGNYTICFENPPVITGWASVVGKKEGQGPLKDTFDRIFTDSTLGERTWEKAESRLQKESMQLAISKSGISPQNISYVFGGDLLNQCIGSTFSLRHSDIPFFGLYGACSTMAEGLILASMTVDGGFSDCSAAITSSHFCAAEKQYRVPLEYGGQRTPNSQWTVTASGAIILQNAGTGPKITHATVGRIEDLGITDVNNMGAAMAPAAFSTLKAFFDDTATKPGDYDLIVTGDLGLLGRKIVVDFFKKDGIDIGQNYDDCGIMIFSGEQDVNAGGSGCGCSAAVLCGYILNSISQGLMKKVIFSGTGALLSPVSVCQGESVPGICHLVCVTA